jgi:hypothetical protein
MNQAIIPYGLITSGIASLLYGAKNLIYSDNQQPAAAVAQQRRKALLVSAIGILALAYGIYALQAQAAQIITDQRRALLATLVTKGSHAPEEAIKSIFDRAIGNLGEIKPDILSHRETIWNAVAPKQIKTLQVFLAQEVNDQILSKFQPEQIDLMLKTQKTIAYSMLSLTKEDKNTYDRLFESFLPIGELSVKERQLSDTLFKRLSSIHTLFEERIINTLAAKAKELSSSIIKDIVHASRWAPASS